MSRRFAEYAGRELSPRAQRQDGRTAHRILQVVAIVLAAALPVWLLYAASDLMLVAFAGVLGGVILRGMADALAARSPLSPRWAVATVAAAVAVLCVAILWLIGATIASQVDQLSKQIPVGLEHVRSEMRRHALGRWAMQNTLPLSEIAGKGWDWTDNVRSLFATTLGVFGNLALFVALALFTALDARTYIDGAIWLLPPDRRSRGRQVFSALGTALRRWAVGRWVAAIFLGTVTGIGLRLVGVPSALALAIMAGLFNVVPFVGPIVAAAIGLIIAVPQGGLTVLLALGVYLFGHVLDNYVVTPYVQLRAVHIPPALLIFTLVLWGVLFGPLGVVLGSPLTVVAFVLVRMLYIEGVLGESIPAPGGKP